MLKILFQRALDILARGGLQVPTDALRREYAQLVMDSIQTMNIMELRMRLFNRGIHPDETVSRRELVKMLSDIVSGLVPGTVNTRHQDHEIVQPAIDWQNGRLMDTIVLTCPSNIKRTEFNATTMATINRMIASAGDRTIIITGFGQFSRKFLTQAYNKDIDDLRTTLGDLYTRLCNFYESFDFQYIHITLVNVRPGRVNRLGKMKLDNCALNIIFNTIGDKGKSIVYKKFPELRPRVRATGPCEHGRIVEICNICSTGDRDHVWIEYNQLEWVAKKLKVTVRLFSEIGAKLNLPPWKEIGNKKKKNIDMKVSREHATVMASGRVEAISYYFDPEADTQTNIISTTRMYIPANECLGDPPLESYVSLDNGKITMHKKYRPSALTQDPTDDMLLRYAYCNNDGAVMHKMWAYESNIEKTPDMYRGILSKATQSMLITRGCCELTDDTVVYSDHNKSYCAAKTSPWYCGFPDATLREYTGAPMEYHDGDLKPVFIIASFSLTGPIARAWTLLRNTTYCVLPYPMYMFLCKHGAVFDFTNGYTIYANLVDIDIVKFYEQFEKRLPAKDFKLARNQSIGRLITGGIKEEKVNQYWGLTDEETQQMTYECMKNGYKFRKQNDCLTITTPRVGNTGSFHTHSYFLAYSAIAVMTKFMEIDAVAPIYGWNCDCIVSGDYNAVPEDRIGGWKIEKGPLKGYLRVNHGNKPVVVHDTVEMKLNTDDYQGTYALSPEDTGYRAVALSLCGGAGGLGKSYVHKVQPRAGLSGPTLSLVEDHRATAKCEVVTTQSKFKLSNTAPEDKYHHVAVDELTMHSREEVAKCIRQTKIFDGLCDFEQINSSIRGTPMTREWFESIGGYYFEKVRIEGRKARHGFKFGSFLDSLRGLKIEDQIEHAQTRLPVANESLMRRFACENLCQVVVGKHSRAHELNTWARANCPRMYFRITQQRHPARGRLLCFERGAFDSALIYWDRKNMTDEMPSGLIFEPAFAVTSDSVQGKTCNSKLFVDTKGMERPGCFYTAVTRCRHDTETTLLV